MSDESKFFKKCKCSHCSLPVSFPQEMAGKTIECPHCKGQTILTKNKEIVEKVVEKPPSAAGPENSGIVHNLDYVGEVFLSLGFFGMVAASISAAFMRYNGVDANQTLSMICIAIVSFLAGLFIKNLFFGMAEIIRQLRAINSRGMAASQTLPVEKLPVKPPT